MSVKRPLEYRLKVGETARIKGAFLTNRAIIYAGMPSDSVYSLVVTWTSGNNTAAYNLYFPKGHREFDLLKGHLTVLDVSPFEIFFRYQKK